MCMNRLVRTYRADGEYNRKDDEGVPTTNTRRKISKFPSESA